MHVPADDGAVSTDVLEVECGGDDLDVVQTELGALRDNLAITGNHGAAVVVKAVAVASLLIRVQVDTTELYETGGDQ